MRRGLPGLPRGALAGLYALVLSVVRSLWEDAACAVHLIPSCVETVQSGLLRWRGNVRCFASARY